jgi:hypothetical protein
VFLLHLPGQTGNLDMRDVILRPHFHHVSVTISFPAVDNGKTIDLLYSPAAVSNIHMC